jgi:hypothetical protein
MTNDTWTQFAADAKRPQDTPRNAYPQSIAEIALLWLPPASVIAFLTKTAQEKGISDEAAQWLHRVTVARQTQEDGE